MSDIDPKIAPEVLAACQAGAAEAASALGRTLGGELTLAVGDAATYDPAAAPSGFAGPALAILFKFGSEGFAAILPESTGLVPAWCAAPDATGESKLSTLAQELSMLLAPETLMADHFEARRVASAATAIARAAPSANAALVALQMTGGGKTGQLSLVWPLASPDKLFAAEAERPAAAPAAPALTSSSVTPVLQKPRRLDELPNYAQSLLKIRVPVSVELATKKEALDEIIEIVAGSIIKFDKGCDQLLQMKVGGQLVAQGEAVKIGEKFGFRVTSMTLPHERFLTVRRPKAG